MNCLDCDEMSELMMSFDFPEEDESVTTCSHWQCPSCQTEFLVVQGRFPDGSPKSEQTVRGFEVPVMHDLAKIADWPD